MKPLARWNPARSVWETNETLICGHSDVWSETFPSSGTWAGGLVYALPTSARPTDGSGSSSSPGLLPTPAAGNFNDGESVESWEARRDRQIARGINGNGMGTPLAISVQLLKTPTSQLAVNGGSQHPDKRKAGGHGPTLADEIEHMLPTPQARDWKGVGPADHERNDPGLPAVVETLLPTPRATDGTKGGPNQRGSSGDLMLPSAVMLLPTPTAMDSKASGGSTPSDVTLTDAVVRTDLGATENPRHLLPTPKAGVNRASRKALTQQHWSAPSLEQALEIARGELPRELTDWSELQGWTGGRTPPPSIGGND